MHEHTARVLYYLQVRLLYASIVWFAAWVLTSIRRGSATTKHWIWLATLLNFILPLGAVVDKFWAPHLWWATLLLVGGSMGGLVALLYAEQNPDKIAGFVNLEGNLAPEDCMFSRNVIPHSYSRFESIVFRQIKKALSAKEGRGFARHLQVLGQANPRAYYDYSFQTVESSFAVWPRTFSNHRIPTIRLEPRLFRSSWYEDFVAVLPRDHL
jgi:pimeloyl-ACP methyl ester carboxylesterase